MELTLRKAAQVITEVKKKLADFEATKISAFTSIKANPAIDVELTVSKKNIEFWSNFNNYIELNEVHNRLRSALAVGNAESKVNEYLTRVACIDNVLKFLVTIRGNMTPTPEMLVLKEEVNQKIRSFNESKSDYYGRVSDSVSVCVLSQQDIQDVDSNIITLKREKVTLTDKILSANTTHKINVLDSDWAFLEFLGVV